MAQQYGNHEPQVWKGALAGAVAGLVASFVVARFHLPVSGRDVPGAATPQPAAGEDDATIKDGQQAAEAMLPRPLPDAESPEPRGQLVHYAFGSAAGALYGMLRETEHAPGGAAFGAELWAIAEQLGLPMAGGAPQFENHSAGTSANSLAAHLVYGLSTATVYSLVRRAL